MARFDQLTNQTTYKDEVWSALLKVESGNPLFSFETVSIPFNTVCLRAWSHDLSCLQLQETLIYGHAAIQAYQTYNEMNYLTYAEKSWLTGSGYAIKSPDQITISGKNSTFETECNGTSMVGGVFETTAENDLYIGGTSTGYFLVLSSLLANVTSNQTYLDTALQSADFIQNHLTNSNNLVIDGIFADICGPGSNNQGAALSSPNSGLAIEGLSILTSMTQNDTIQTWMEKTLSSSVLDSSWNNGNGIMIENTHFNIITGYVAAFEHSTNSDLQQFTKGYLSIQYNAVLGNAAINGSVTYGDLWTEPQKKNSDSGQISALSILVNAMALNKGNDTTSPPDSPSSSSKRNVTGIIVGSITGSLGFILGVVAAFIYLHKRHHKDQERSLQSPIVTTPPHSYYDNSYTSTDTSYQNSVNFRYHTTETLSDLWENEKESLQDSSSIQHVPLPNLSSITDQHPVSHGGMQGEEGGRRVIPTEQLIRMLAGRMQGEVQDGDLPPAYHTHQ
ncbi:hypothetical protein K435DRAFT_849129 [Dendrothele bispora CBS 962.96]|uniref:Glycoside hydrolase family 76 protein n=1 Tax=Dendrothele bispora (strain CBS 962.96) TaxID=1314807 RepID=A0A4S8MV88_DENBC|nr:hypothetical protein K435DRAFT_849129 [Dendrothele bispora CBS 962.96]